mmetsp:Transcript_108914/g.295264  ORF Transcript_108914/g.295264 Transcript_108914/m.295264 type:complete len:230 (-) Transcript_108914:603-1292(-)
MLGEAVPRAAPGRQPHRTWRGARVLPGRPGAQPPATTRLAPPAACPKNSLASFALSPLRPAGTMSGRGTMAPGGSTGAPSPARAAAAAGAGASPGGGGAGSGPRKAIVSAGLPSAVFEHSRRRTAAGRSGISRSSVPARLPGARCASSPGAAVSGWSCAAPRRRAAAAPRLCAAAWAALRRDRSARSRARTTSGASGPNAPAMWTALTRGVTTSSGAGSGSSRPGGAPP